VLPPGTRASSTIVFHSPQPGQRPCQRGASAAHWEQMKVVFARAIVA
jgi:hypothetical protein